MMMKPTIETIRPWLIERGLADNAQIDDLLAEGLACSHRPDAFLAHFHCAAVGWV